MFLGMLQYPLSNDITTHCQWQSPSRLDTCTTLHAHFWKNLPITVTYSGALSRYSHGLLVVYLQLRLLPLIYSQKVPMSYFFISFTSTCPNHCLFTSPSSYVPSCFGTISSKKMLPAIFMLLSHFTFSF